MRKKSKRPDFRALLEAGLSVPVALEACLRESVGGKRLGTWIHLRGVHASTVSQVLRGTRRDSTIRHLMAKDIGVSFEELGEIIDGFAHGR
jgi:hypothetical protein